MPIVSGIISGFVASFMFFMWLCLIRPKVDVSKEVTVEEVDGKVYYRVKVVNLTRAMLTNLRYSLYYCKENRDTLVKMHEIPPKSTKLACIAAYDKKDKLNEYAVVFKYEVNPEEMPMEEGCKLVFYFLADHGVSNTSACIRKSYYKDDIVRAVFARGKSTDIVIQ